MLELNSGLLLSNTLYLARLAFHERIDEDAAVSEHSKKIYLEACDRLQEYLEICDLKASMRALSRIQGNLGTNDKFKYSDFKELSDDLFLRMRDELELTPCFVLESSRGRFYEPEEPLFGNAVASFYPSAYQEIEEAGKCLALGRSTACVFHLMRTMEVGVRAVANGLRIPDPTKPAEKNWGAIIRKIHEAIVARQRWRRKADKAFYEEAVASLDAVKNPWRNATMHVEKTYTEEEAENIFYIVRGFMMKIASRIDESGKFV
ncbi:hypothetical protein [Pelagibius sp.]|uniref:hypothetical protein n=1 Tax=Pelagibius sp. TaxID=1931238 RepID=UPI00263975F0|nr:hypothetical protein [Pelagibius sp.]